VAGTFNRRCDNPLCRRIVMVSDRGRVGDAFGSTVETDEHGVPHATCPVCQTVTPWPSRSADGIQKAAPRPLSGVRLARLAECIEDGSHVSALPAPAGSAGRLVTVQQPCARCGTVFAQEGLI
jgi:hypothetical protein